MPIYLSTPFYIGAFVLLVIIIIILLIISPTQKSFFDLQEYYPILYYNLHKNEYLYKEIINEIVNNTGIKRVDIENPLTNDKLEWIDYSPKKYSYIRGKVEILPIYYQGKFYDNYKYFPKLMNLMQIQPNILNIYFWKLSSESALLQHFPKLTNGNSNIHESNILDLPILRYTLAINVLTCMEEECSLWVSGHLKKLVFDKYLLWDPNKEFSLHNDSDTDGDVLFLNIDLKNPFIH
jgi:hypothetical protein